MIAALRPFVLSAAGLLLAGVTVALVLVHLFQRSILFPAPAPDRAAPTAEAFGGEQVWLRHEGGRTEAWYLPAAPGRAIPAPLIVFAHGNGELIDYWGDNWGDARRWGVSVLLVEYPGYGRSDGAPSE